MSYVGKRNKDTLKTGVWQGHYQLKRDNQIVIDIKPQLTINNLKGSLQNSEFRMENEELKLLT